MTLIVHWEKSQARNLYIAVQEVLENIQKAAHRRARYTKVELPVEPKRLCGQKHKKHYLPVQCHHNGNPKHQIIKLKAIRDNSRLLVYISPQVSTEFNHTTAKPNLPP